MFLMLVIKIQVNTLIYMVCSEEICCTSDISIRA